MEHNARDCILGLHRSIPRRDFLNGVALTGAWASLPQAARAALAQEPDAGDPAQWTGLRGSTTGTFETAHALRDGQRWDDAPENGEDYDLVVVGAGLSGLAAAWFYRARTGGQARILLLDNHDDFGGHARRNAFLLGGRQRLLHGGSVEIDSPRPYSAQAAGLLRALGVDLRALERSFPVTDFFDAPGRKRGVFFDQETFGADHLAVGRAGKSWVHFLEAAPLTTGARADLLRITEAKIDYLPGMRSEQKKELLAGLSYAHFLRDYAKVDPQVLTVLQTFTHELWGVGIDAVSALDCWGVGGEAEMPGFQGLRLAPGASPRMGFSAAGYSATGGSEHFHFPDGNATLARLLVRALIPAAAPAGAVEDLVHARFDYGRLDRAEAPVRLRLSSTAVRVLHRASDDGVDVSYVHQDRAQRVRARACVLACYNAVIPHLCPELPAAQREALRAAVRTPMVYANIALRNWRPFHALGVLQIDAPGSYFSRMYLNPDADRSARDRPATPEDPAIVQLQRTPCSPGLPERDQNRAGRAELLATDYTVFERNIRAQLARMLDAGGFDPARDIHAITVNRWSHGYAPEFNPLFEPLQPESLRPHVIGRRPFGRIAIANSDSGGGAFADVAIDQAHRAVGELLA